MSQPRQHPLAHLALAAGEARPEAEVILRALPHQPALILRGESDDPAFLEAARSGLGFDLPLAPNHAASGNGVVALWQSPNEWRLLGPDSRSRLAPALAGCRHAMVDIGDGQQIMSLSGPRAGDVLSKLCPLDLEGTDLSPGRCARSVLAGIAVLVVPQDGGGYHLHVGRSFADFAWRILADAGLEFGLWEAHDA